LGLQLAVATAKRAGHCAVRPFHILVVEYDIVPAEIDKYLAAIKDLGAAAVKEPGCRQLSIAVSQKDPNHVLLFEAWDSAAAFDAFLATNFFKNYQATIGNMIAKRDIRYGPSRRSR
jgi:autoinducer 2-degrading protein